MRLNKYIADSGICSRRKADELIEKGLVKPEEVVVYTIDDDNKPIESKDTVVDSEASQEPKTE